MVAVRGCPRPGEVSPNGRWRPRPAPCALFSTGARRNPTDYCLAYAPLQTKHAHFSRSLSPRPCSSSRARLAPLPPMSQAAIGSRLVRASASLRPRSFGLSFVRLLRFPLRFGSAVVRGLPARFSRAACALCPFLLLWGLPPAVV